MEEASAIEELLRSADEGHCSLLSADGSTLLTREDTNSTAISEHFGGVLNRPSTISGAAIARLPQVETNVALDLPPSLRRNHQDRAAALQWEAPLDRMRSLLRRNYRASLQAKGNRQLCDNHRVSPRLNIAGKIFARILLNRLNNHLEEGLLPEIQYGFRCHRETTNMIFASRQLTGEVPGDEDSPGLPLLKHRREDPPQSPEQSSGTGPSAGKPMRFPSSSWDHGYDLRRPSIREQVPGDADPPVLYLRGPDESLRHGES
ncbi:hypothetical protein SprV_0702428200 [Sparganum proliferum]